jgi:hypothetical protein
MNNPRKKYLALHWKKGEIGAHKEEVEQGVLTDTRQPRGVSTGT